MSGGNCPETPRQKMIGMMYLMLTAMLALNVSGDLLKAYILVDKSILQAKSAIEDKNKSLYQQFEVAYESNKNKVGKTWTEVQALRDKADELVKYIQDTKIKLVRLADGDKKVDAGISTPEHFENTSNQDYAGQLMVTQGESKNLKAKMGEYKELLLSLVDKEDTALIMSIEEGLSTESQPSKEDPHATWDSQKFEHLPLAASMALMSQIQSTSRNLESDVVRYLYGKMDAESFKFNKVDPLVIQKSDYILQGDEYFARIMIAARDTTQPPTINIPGRNVVIDETGVGIMRFPATTVGSSTWKGEISIKAPDGKSDLKWPIEASYIVAQPSLVVSAVKMNVFYESIQNPIEISVPGVASELLSVDVTNATSVKQGNQFLITPRPGTAGQKVTISVSAKMNNANKPMGKADFRVKRLPPPVAKVNSQTEGKIAKALLMAQSGVVAEMEDFDFDGIKWTVTSFKVSAVVGGYVKDEPSSSSQFTKAQIDLIKLMTRGQKVTIEEIKAVGPGDQKKTLNPIIFLLD